MADADQRATLGVEGAPQACMPDDVVAPMAAAAAASLAQQGSLKSRDERVPSMLAAVGGFTRREREQARQIALAAIGGPLTATERAPWLGAGRGQSAA